MRDGESNISTAMVCDEALNDAAEEIKKRKLENVGEHARKLQSIIEERGPVDRETLLNTYRNRVPDPRSERSVDDYLAKLDDYALIERRGPPQERRYVATDG
jgi:hypothetical protein